MLICRVPEANGSKAKVDPVAAAKQALAAKVWEFCLSW
jgi:hypothetical protein